MGKIIAPAIFADDARAFKPCSVDPLNAEKSAFAFFIMTILSSNNPQGGRIRLEYLGDETGGEFVIYWMATALRAKENPALEAAAAFATDRGLPFVIYQGVFASAPHASDRHVAFVLEGVPALTAALTDRGLRHLLHIVRDRETEVPPKMLSLFKRAALIVAEDFPCSPFPVWREKLAAASGRPIYVVDTACILPMQIVGRPYDRASQFRKSTATRRAGWIDQLIQCTAPPPLWTGDPGFESETISDEKIPALLASMQIDHTVGRVHELRGGEEPARRRWTEFLQGPLEKYAEDRADAVKQRAVSGLSPYLHHGMIAAWQVAREARDANVAGSSKFLDELTVWREMAYCFCRFHAEHDTLEALPPWAREALFHQANHRGSRPSLDEIERGQTGDALFDLAQQSLLRHGTLHNNVRMTWGKCIASWMRDAGEGLQLALDLNNRYALDGSDPNSIGGVQWCFGLFDTAQPQATLRLGTVRARTSEAHQRRLNMQEYEVGVKENRSGISDCLIVGAGMAGLSAARTLSDHGVRAVVLDKGRGVGGRMATRRFEGGVFDHGAQFFTVRDPVFERNVLNWADAGVVTRWALGFPGVEAAENMDHHTRFRGTRGMTNVPKHLSANLQVHLQVKVDRIRRSGGGWEVSAESASSWKARSLILTMPVPQTVELLASSDMLTDGLRDQLSSIQYYPCIALLAILDGPSGLPEPGAIKLTDPTAPLAWIADNHMKGISPNAHAVTIHAQPDFSAEHYDWADEQLAPVMAAAAQPYLAAPIKKQILRRWKFSLPQSDSTPPIISVGGEAPLVIGGDGLGGARVEGAALSGYAAAGWLLSLP